MIQRLISLLLIPRKKYGPSMTSGRTEKKQARMIVRACRLFGSTFEAIKNPAVRDKITSAITIKVEFFVTLPYFLISVFKCGFQWGTFSRTKWDPKASGKAISGFEI